MHITRTTKIFAVAVAGLTLGAAGISAGAGGGSAPTADHAADPTSNTIEFARTATDALADTAGTNAAAARPSADADLDTSRGADDSATTNAGVEHDDEPAPRPADGEPAASTTDLGHEPVDEPSTEASDAPAPPEPSEPEQPDDEIDEPTAPGEPGVVHGHGAHPEPPPPTPGASSELASIPNEPPPAPTIPGPVDISTPLPGPDPAPIDDFVVPQDPTPIPGPSDLQTNPIPGHVGEITSGLTGCQLDCVTSALLSANPANPNVQLDVETTIPVHFEIEITETGTDSSQLFNNPGYDTTYGFDISPLKPDTTYDLMMIAIDQDGHSQMYEHQFTTVDVIDGFAGNAKGCALDCITEGVVDKTADFSKVELHIETSSPAAMQVWVSTGEPTWVDDPDAKPAYDPVLDNDTPSTSWTFDVSNLDESTTYHVVARAEDEFGVHFRVGEFTTDDDPNVNVSVGFERITVTHDGDKHALNRGEIAFGWGFNSEQIGWRSEEKMHAGSFDLGGSNTKWFSIDADTGVIPEPMVNADERDADGLVEFCSAGDGITDEPIYIASCDSKTNVATFGRDLTLAEIEEYETCLAYGVTTAGVGARCAAISTSTFGTRDDDYAHFIVYVSFFIA